MNGESNPAPTDYVSYTLNHAPLIENDEKLQCIETSNTVF